MGRRPSGSQGPHRPGESPPSGIAGGACGNVDQGGTRHPPRVSKERVLETLHLKLCAPQIYPDPSDKKPRQTATQVEYTRYLASTILAHSGYLMFGACSLGVRLYYTDER